MIDRVDVTDSRFIELAARIDAVEALIRQLNGGIYDSTEELDSAARLIEDAIRMEAALRETLEAVAIRDEALNLRLDAEGERNEAFGRRLDALEESPTGTAQ